MLLSQVSYDFLAIHLNAIARQERQFYGSRSLDVCLLKCLLPKSSFTNKDLFLQKKKKKKEWSILHLHLIPACFLHLNTPKILRIFNKNIFIDSSE